MFTIYKATNKINGHSYVGFDCNWPYRKTAHKCAVTRGSTLVFHNAIRKYGWENFEWEIVEQSEDGNRLLSEQEEFYIRKFNSHYLRGDGYNMTFGGEGTLGWVPSEETKKKISRANKGRQFSVSTKELWSKQRTGKKQSASHIAASIVVRQKTWNLLKSGQLIEVTNMRKYCRDHNLSAGNMSMLLHGKLNRYKDYTAIAA